MSNEDRYATSKGAGKDDKSILPTRVLHSELLKIRKYIEDELTKHLVLTTPTTARLVMHPPMTCKQTASITEQQEPGLIGQAKRIQLVAGTDKQNKSAMNVYEYKQE